MKNGNIGLLIFGAITVFFALRANAETTETVEFAGDDQQEGDMMSGIDTAGANDPIPAITTRGDDMTLQLAAFLATIRKFESGDNYSALYGGGNFSGFSSHPNVRRPINLPGYEGKVSTAAGAYQINFPTYKDFAPKLGITDFTPESQDALAVAILNTTGAVHALGEGNLIEAFHLASKRWASLPGSNAGQHPKSINTAIAAFRSFGGSYA